MTAHNQLSDICELRRETCLPQDFTGVVYVGLEHIDSGLFSLSRHGNPSAVRSAKTRFYTGDVLFGKLRPYLDKAAVAECEGICSTDILVLKPCKVPSWYLCGILHADRFIEHAKQTTHGVNHPRTSWSGIKVFETNHLTPSEQKIIAAVLLKMQQAIETQKKIILSLRDLKKSTMQHLFSHGLHSENWNTTTFVDFATLHRGYDLPVHARTEGAVPIIGSNGITGHHNEAKITGPGVVTGRSGSIGISHYVEQDFWPLNTSLYVCDFHGNFPLFVHYFFEWFNFRKYATGTGVPTLNRNLVHRDSIKVPHETEQKEIARTLAVIDTDLALHESKRVTLRDLFKMTLNKLMTRDILVVDLDIEMKKVHA